jgi:uncharacterized protein YndB with AHSA1/START domain
MITPEELPHRLERTLVIQAGRSTVFRFFTDPARWAAWWGPGSTIDARIGGALLIRYPDGTEARGEVVELTAPERFVFTYGYSSGKPIPPGSSIVTIELQELGNRTRLRLSHALAEPGVRDAHVQGWRYQLSVFANVVADEAHAAGAGIADGWFAAWSEPDAAARETALRSLCADHVRLHDRFSAIQGLADVTAHVAAAQRFMPGIRMEREGEIRQCQGMVLADWITRSAGTAPSAAGTNVFVLDGDGKIDSVTGFWSRNR